MLNAGMGPLGAHFFQVHELVAYIKELFAADPILSDVWISGEVCDVTTSAAGHCYFTIRDGEARIPAVMFRSAIRRQTLPLVAGYEALIHGAVSIYDQRSIFQLVADLVLPGDAGALQAQFEAMRLRLEQEGLFAPERKRELPLIPQWIGIATSESGAVIHDMLRVWQRRFRHLNLVLAPTAVQGDDAPRQIVAALARLNEFHAMRHPLDLIIVARGGGAPEELAVFNDERVARAIFASRVAVVSAIGHEVDYTIADLVADMRAPTPSAAAEMVVPDAAELCREVERLRERMRWVVEQKLATARAQTLAAHERLLRHSPEQLVADRRRDVDELAARATRAVQVIVSNGRLLVESRRTALGALSPEQTLARGYAVCAREDDGRVLTDASGIQPGELIAIRLARGRMVGEVITSKADRGEPIREATHAE
jgi:exodeoxyribonuclease VII large subunit